MVDAQNSSSRKGFFFLAARLSVHDSSANSILLFEFTHSRYDCLLGEKLAFKYLLFSALCSVEKGKL